MRVYHDATTGDVLYTYDGPDDLAPAGAYIEVPTLELATLNGLQVVGGTLVLSDLTARRAQVIAEVNLLAGRKRRTFITDLPGQEMLYLKKEAEASAYLATSPEPADLSGFPLMSAEVGAGLTAPTAYQLAQIWLYMGHAWKIAAGQIETARLGAVYAIEGATSEAVIDAALAGYRAVMS